MMSEEHFWFVDDAEHVRWAVRVSSGHPHPGRRVFGGEQRILFTSHARQISTEYALDKDEQQLTRYEVLELLAQAKREVCTLALPLLAGAA
jgi:hypothetical protein